MSAGVDSIPPLAVDFGSEVAAAARVAAQLRESLYPRAPELLRDRQSALAGVSTALPMSAPLLTAVAFRPDGHRALAIELTLLHCVALGVGSIAALSGAIWLGWIIGEWTALL